MCLKSGFWVPELKIRPPGLNPEKSNYLLTISFNWGLSLTLTLSSCPRASNPPRSRPLESVRLRRRRGSELGWSLARDPPRRGLPSDPHALARSLEALRSCLRNLLYRRLHQGPPHRKCLSVQQTPILCYYSLVRIPNPGLYSPNPSFTNLLGKSMEFTYKYKYFSLIFWENYA